MTPQLKLKPHELKKLERNLRDGNKERVMHNRFEGKSIDEVLTILEHGNTNERAAAIALQYGGIDEAHHKQWIIDQMLRVISGAGYSSIIAAYNSDPEYNKWDEGIAP